MLNFRQYNNITKVILPNKIKVINNDFSNRYNSLSNLTYRDTPINVTNMSSTYSWCFNLTGSPVCGDNVTDMTMTYYNCRNLTGSPVCGDKVISMYNTYYYCSNLTGSPVCGNNVTSMSNTYQSCSNLTGNPVCGDNVYGMYNTYGNCFNLTGNPVCGNNVTDMDSAYYGCSNLTGSPVCGDKVISMYATYFNCINLYGNMYMYSPNVSDMTYCFYERNTSNILNIYVLKNSTSFNTCIINNTRSITGFDIEWANNGTCWYNTSINTYIYPVDDVAQARQNNGD